MTFLKRSAIVLAAVFSVAATQSSCKKDETVTPPAADVTPIIKAFFVNGAFTITTTGSGGYEYGCKFQVTRNGKATKLGCKMPAAGSYRVTLWDASVTPQVSIAEATVTQPAGQATTFVGISPVGLSTGKDYLVSIYSTGAWNYVVPSGGGNISYPISSGNISIRGYQWTSSATATPKKFPNSIDQSYVAGLADLEFQAD